MKNMNLKLENALVAVAFALFSVDQTWQSVCVILISALLKSLCVYSTRQQKVVDVQKLEEKIAKAQQDIKSINLKLGFSRA